MNKRFIIIGLAAFALLTCGCIGTDREATGGGATQAQPVGELNVSSPAFPNMGSIPDIYIRAKART